MGQVLGAQWCPDPVSRVSRLSLLHRAIAVYGGSVNGSGVIFAGARPEISASSGLWVRGCARLLVPFNAYVASATGHAFEDSD